MMGIARTLVEAAIHWCPFPRLFCHHDNGAYGWSKLSTVALTDAILQKMPRVGDDQNAIYGQPGRPNPLPD